MELYWLSHYAKSKISIPDLLEASNGDGTMVFLSTQTKQVVTVKPRLGELSADTMAFDEVDHLLAVVNGDDEISVVSFIDTSRRKKTCVERDHCSSLLRNTLLPAEYKSFHTKCGRAV